MNGAHLVSLAPLRDAELVPDAIAQIFLTKPRLPAILVKRSVGTRSKKSAQIRPITVIRVLFCEAEGVLLVPKAGEMLYRVSKAAK